MKILILATLLTFSLQAWETATVKRVVDGDTIIIQIGSKTISSRLIGFDTPESVYNKKASQQSQRCSISLKEIVVLGKISKRYTFKRLKKGLKIDFIEFGEDYYHRKLIWVKNFNYRIVKDGFAKAYKRADLPRSIKQKLKEAENQARKKNIGIWSLLPVAKKCY